MQITDSEYQEYQDLKAQANRIAIFSSLKEVSTLEDDVDLPIKKCVAYFALLGCEPMWSCCGFDYVGQPLHKSHQSGFPHIVIMQNAYSDSVVGKMAEYAKTNPFLACWHSTEHRPDNMDCITISTNIIRPGGLWNDKNCIHFSELGATYIGYLEEFLLSLKDCFASECVVKSTNATYQERFPNWQYPPKADWVIRKSDYIKE